MAEEGMTLKVTVEGKVSVWENIVYGLQHFFLIGQASIITPIIFVAAFASAGPLAINPGQIPYLVGAMLIGAGLVTLSQSLVLLKLPIAQGQNIILIVLMISTAFQFGWGVTFAGLLIAGILATLLTLPFNKGIIGWLAKSITPPPVYGTLILLIGLTLAPQVAMGNMIFSYDGSISGSNIILALVAFLVPMLIMLTVKRGFIRNASIIIGLAVAVIVAIAMGKIDWSSVGSAAWFTVPQFFPLGFQWDWGPVLLSGLIMFIGYLAAISESIGVYTVVTEMDPSQKLTRSRVNKGIFGETLTSLVGSVFGSVPATSFAQNIGLIAMTGVGARSVITTCGILLVVFGFFYKIGAIVAVIPYAVYGGSLLAVLAMLISVGISSLAKMKWNGINMAIVGTGCAVGISALYWNIQPASKAILDTLHPVWGIFLGSPALLGFLVAWILHSIFMLRSEKKPEPAPAANPSPAEPKI